MADNIVHDKNIERRTIIQQQYKHIHQNTNAIKETEHTVLSLTSIFIFIAFVKPSRGREFSHDHNHDRNMVTNTTAVSRAVFCPLNSQTALLALQ